MNGSRIEVDFAIGHELFTSLYAFQNKAMHKNYQLGSSWAKRVAETVSPATKELLAKTELHDSLINILLLQCPHKNSATKLLHWIENLPLGEMYEILSPYAPEGKRELPHLEEWRARMVALLSAWQEEYFQYADQGKHSALMDDALKKQKLAEVGHPADFIEETTNGLRMDAILENRRVILIPQYHVSPYNLTNEYRGLSITYYSAEMEAVDPDAPSVLLLNIAKALADENRLRILKFLTKGETSFTEIVQMLGLAKSTVHYHMVSLRSAGLVRVHMQQQGREKYSLRRGALNKLNHRLSDYLGIDLDEL